MLLMMTGRRRQPGRWPISELCRMRASFCRHFSLKMTGGLGWWCVAREGGGAEVEEKDVAWLDPVWRMEIVLLLGGIEGPEGGVGGDGRVGT